jgi:hypothetical protein
VKGLVSALTLIFLLSVQVWAGQDLVPGSRYTSGRAAAMGDAFIPLADDGATSLFYNPAGIGRIRQPQAEPINFQLYGNSGFTGSAGTQFYNAPSLGGYMPVLTANPGTLVNTGAAIAPVFSMRGFAFGMLINTQMMGRANSDGSVYHRSLYQLVPTIGVGTRLAGGIVRIGYSLQWVNQASGDYTSDPTETDHHYTANLAQGSALSHTVGFALTLPYALLPSVNFVGRNLLTARFGGYSLFGFARSPGGVPENEPASFDASFSLQPRMGRGGYINLVAQLRDMTNTSGMSILGRASAGVEFAIRNQLFFRGGWRSGYPSAGIGFKRNATQFSFSWYSEEIGSSYHNLRDTKFLIHYQVGVFN